MNELFDPFIRLTLLEQCERFSRETGASLTVTNGFPLLAMGNGKAEVHLTKFHVDDESYLSPMMKIEDCDAWLIRYYFENLTDYRNLKKALLSCFGKKAKTELYRLPSFQLPQEAYDELMDTKRVYLDYDLKIVEDYRLASYVFIVFTESCIQYCRRWGLDKALYRTCEVFPAKPSQNGVLA